MRPAKFLAKSTSLPRKRRWRRPKFLAKSSPQPPTSHARRPTFRPRPRKFLLESLEPRLLLSAEPFYTAAAATAAADLTLRLDNENGVETLKLFDTVLDEELASEVLSDGAGVIEIIGSDFDDILIVDASVLLSIPITFDGGTGSDTLTGPSADSTWIIDDANAGKVAGVTFRSIENLEGAADNEDTFVFQPGGIIDGVIDGGDAGFDTLVVDYSEINSIRYDASGPDSGTVTIDGNMINFVGLEPVTFGGANPDMVISDLTVTATTGADSLTLREVAGDTTRLELVNTNASPPTIETPNFKKPTGSLTIDLGAGNDTLTIGNVGTFDLSSLTVKGGADTGGVGDTVVVQRDLDMVLTDTSLTVGGRQITLDGVENANLTGGSGDNTFTLSNWTGAGSVLGGAGNNSLVGANIANAWVIDSENAGTLNGQAFSDIENLIGGTDVDTFTLNANVTGMVDGGEGADVFNLNVSVAGMVKGGAGNDEFHLANRVMIGSLDSGAETDTLTASDHANIWTLTGANQGTVGTQGFSGFENLNGGTAADQFLINAGASLGGRIDGRGGSDMTVLALPAAVGNFNIQDSGTGIADQDELDQDELEVSGSVSGDVFGISPTTVTLGSQTVNYSGLEGLDVIGEGGDDTFNVTTSSDTRVHIVAGGGTNDTLHLDGESLYFLVQENQVILVDPSTNAQRQRLTWDDDLEVCNSSSFGGIANYPETAMTLGFGELAEFGRDIERLDAFGAPLPGIGDSGGNVGVGQAAGFRDLFVQIQRLATGAYKATDATPRL